MNSPLQVLHLEDNAADTELIQATLDAEGVHARLSRVETEVDFIGGLKNGRFDLILADYTLPSFDGLSALRIAQQRAPDIPFIFVSGTLGEDIAIEALKRGATDYVLKTRLSRLVSSVQRALHVAEERAERKKAEEALRRSERELREVIETIPAIVWSALPDASNVMMSSRWAQYTGLSGTGLGWQAAAHPDDLERHLKVFRACSAAGVPFEDEVRFSSADGEYRWFLVQGTPLRDEQGHILKWYGIVTDIEDRKRAEEKIRQSEAELRQLIDVIPQQVAVFDADWSPLFANQREREYTGLTIEEMQSKDAVTRIIHPDDVTKLESMRKRALLDTAPCETEVRIKGQDGQYRWFLIKDNPLRDEQGRVLRWYGTRTDIEERKQAEEALQKTKAELAHVARLTTMGELTSSIAHEVSQPLTAIVTSGNACLRWLSNNPPNVAEAKELVSRIVKDGHRASDVVQRIRGFFKKNAPETVSLEINHLIKDVIAMVPSELSRNRVQVKTELAVDLPPVIGDPIQLQQVLLNLVINSIEALSKVDHARELLIKSQRYESDSVLVAVRDNGAGFDETSDQLLEPFYTTKSKGLGMGLSISRTTIEAYGGRLWATTNSGNGGATFQFTLPAK